MVPIGVFRSSGIVRINEAAAGYFRVNHAFRRMLIPKAGTYTISYCYWPRHFTLSLVLALAGLALLAGCAGPVLWRDKRGYLEPGEINVLP